MHRAVERQRHDVKVDRVAGLALAQTDTLRVTLTSRLRRLRQGRPRLAGEVVTDHVEQVQGRPARPVGEVGCRVAAELDDAVLGIDRDSRRRKLGQQGLVGLLTDAGVAFCRHEALCPRRGACAGRLLVAVDGPADRGGRSATDEASLRKTLCFLSTVSNSCAAPADRLRAAEHQIALRHQAVVQAGDDAALQGGTEVDEQVAAAHQVEPGEGRIGREVVAGKDAQVTHGLADLIAVLCGGEVAPQQIGGDLRRDALRVGAATRALQGRAR